VEHEEDVLPRERAASLVGNRLDVIAHAFDEWQVGRVGKRLVLRAEDLKEPARGCVPARGGGSMASESGTAPAAEARRRAPQGQPGPLDAQHPIRAAFAGRLAREGAGD
jgi:hypothetical protein